MIINDDVHDVWHISVYDVNSVLAHPWCMTFCNRLAVLFTWTYKLPEQKMGQNDVRSFPDPESPGLCVPPCYNCVIWGRLLANPTRMTSTLPFLA
jgi:hypothetical protein